MSARVGVDIGGTFTDIVLRLDDGTLRISKVSSTPGLMLAAGPTIPAGADLGAIPIGDLGPTICARFGSGWRAWTGDRSARSRDRAGPASPDYA